MQLTSFYTTSVFCFISPALELFIGKNFQKKSFHALLPAVPIRLLSFFSVFQQVTAQFITLWLRQVWNQNHMLPNTTSHQKYLNYPLKETFNSLLTAKMHVVFLHPLIWDKCKSPKEIVSDTFAKVESSAVTETVCLCLSPTLTSHSPRPSWQPRGRNGPLGPWLPQPCVLSCGQHPARGGSLLSI